VRQCGGGRTRIIQDCEIDNNIDNGIALNADSRGPITFIGGSIHDNGATGCRMGEDVAGNGLFGTEIYANDGDGVQFTPGGALYGCTIYGNGGDGVEFSSFDNIGTAYIVNNTIAENGGFGLNYTGSDDEILCMIDYNHYDNNTSGETSFASTPGDNNVSGDPKFTNITAGSEDFIPLNTSPLIRAGISGTTIGARHEQDPAGGGGGIAHIVGSGGIVG